MCETDAKTWPATDWRKSLTSALLRLRIGLDGLDGVDLVKDPPDSGSLTRSTTLKSTCNAALVSFHFFAFFDREIVNQSLVAVRCFADLRK